MMLLICIHKSFFISDDFKKAVCYVTNIVNIFVSMFHLHDFEYSSNVFSNLLLSFCFSSSFIILMCFLRSPFSESDLLSFCFSSSFIILMCFLRSPFSESDHSFTVDSTRNKNIGSPGFHYIFLLYLSGAMSVTSSMNDSFISSQSFPSRQMGSSIKLASLKSIRASNI